MSAAAADLAGLVDRLRASGFHIDTRQYLTAHELLYQYARNGKPLLDDPVALASHLGPIFCTQVAEQDRFAAEVVAWRGVFAPLGPAGQRGGAPFSAWRLWRKAILLAILGFALFIGVGLALIHDYRDVTVDGVIVIDPMPASGLRDVKVRFLNRPIDVGSDGRFRLSTTRAAGFAAVTAELDGYVPASSSVDADTPSPVDLRLTPLPPTQEPARLRIERVRAVSLGAPAPELRVGGAPWLQIAWLSALTAIVAFALLAASAALRRRLARQRLEAFAEQQRQLALRRLEHAGGVDEISLTPPPASGVDVDDFALRRIASAWRRPREQAVFDLDTVATIDTTLRSGGLFAPVYTPRRSSPEYLGLVHRRSDGDHWARYVMEWLDKLAASGVAVDVLTFHDDPRTCYDTGKRRRAYRLETVLAQHHRATVLVFAESRLLYTSGDSLEPWAQSLWALPRRALFTPELPYRWGHREWTLASEGFVVLPANAAGFGLFGEASVDWRIDRLFPASYARGYPRALSANTERWLSRDAPTKEVVQNLVRQVKGYLGPKGFEWLCACAVYPQIAWPLTLYLARGNGARLDLLPALGRLPWLRYGFMPDWLRGTLIAQMTAQQDGNVRGAIESLLEEIAAAAKPADATQLRAGGGALTVARWIGPADLLGAAPAGSPLSDRVFLGFMSRSNVDPLSVGVKDSLLGLFRGRAKAFEAEQPTPEVETPSRGESQSHIFVSYRRSDSAERAGRLMDALRARWPGTGMFLDNASMVTGADWSSTIEEELRGADLVLAIVGPRWIERYASEDGPPEPDSVHREIAAALAHEKRVIPVLVSGASMPSEKELPPGLRPLAGRQAIELRDSEWREDVERLLERITPFVRTAGKSRPAAARTRISMRTRAVDAVAAGRQAARVALARLRGMAAYRPFTAAGVVGTMVGLAAALVLWRLLPHELVPVAPDSGLSFAAFSPDGRLLAVRDAAGQAMLVDVASGTTTQVRATSGGGVTAAAFARDGSTLFVGYRDGALLDFQLPLGKQTHTSTTSIANSGIIALGVRADDSRVVVRSNGIAIVSNVLEVPSDRTDEEAYTFASFNPTVDVVALAVRGAGVRVDQIAVGRSNPSFNFLSAFSGCALSVAPVLSLDRIACADVDGRAVVYDFRKGPPAVPVRMETQPGVAPSSLAFTSDGSLLAVVRDNAVAFFDVANARPLGSAQLAGVGRAAAFSTSGNTLAVAGQTSVEFFDVVLSGSTGGNIIGPSRDDVIAAQGALNLLGYNAGGADGSMGASTRAAVTKFQQDKGLPATGALDDPTLAALRSAQSPGTTQVQPDLVPSIIGMTANAARELLDRHQFVFGTQLIRPSSARVGTITSQSPARGTRAPTAAKVDVVLSDGSLVRVPNVVGLDIGIAEKKMVAAGLKPSLSGNGLVKNQNPAPRTEVVRSAEVRLIGEPLEPPGAKEKDEPKPAPPGQGWCCMGTLGVVIPMSADECRMKGGKFSTSQAAASRMCPRVPAIQGGSKF